MPVHFWIELQFPELQSQVSARFRLVIELRASVALKWLVIMYRLGIKEDLLTFQRLGLFEHESDAFQRTARLVGKTKKCFCNYHWKRRMPLRCVIICLLYWNTYGCNFIKVSIHASSICHANITDELSPFLSTLNSS